MAYPGSVNSIGQDPRLNDWYTLKSKFAQSYAAPKVEETRGTSEVGGLSPATEATTVDSVNYKSPYFASDLAYDGVYYNQAGREGYVGANFDSNKLWI